MNKAILKGRLGQAPETRQLESGNSITSFSLATSKKYTDKNGERQEVTQWHNCIAWNKTGDFISQYFEKGQEILLEGEIEYTNSEQDGVKRYYTNINIRSVEFCGSSSRPSVQEDRVSAAAQQAPTTGIRDDLPF